MHLMSAVRVDVRGARHGLEPWRTGVGVTERSHAGALDPESMMIRSEMEHVRL